MVIPGYYSISKIGAGVLTQQGGTNWNKGSNWHWGFLNIMIQFSTRALINFW